MALNTHYRDAATISPATDFFFDRCFDFGNPHAEFGFVPVPANVGVSGQGEVGDVGAEFGLGLGGGEDGDGEDFGRPEELLGRREDGWELMDGFLKGGLHVADAGGGISGGGV